MYQTAVPLYLRIVEEGKVVGDPGIEPGVRLREGVTVPCHTLRPVAHRYENTSNERLNRRTNHVRQH